MGIKVSTNNKEETYNEDGRYEGIITDEETGKKYKVSGVDQFEDKPNQFFGPKGDFLKIEELAADGSTNENGLVVSGVKYHEHRIKHGRGIDSWYEDVEDNFQVFPEGRKNSRVGFYLNTNGSLKAISSIRNAEDRDNHERSEVTKKDSLYNVYKALYQKKYAKLVKDLIEGAQKIRTVAQKQNLKAQSNSGVRKENVQTL